MSETIQQPAPPAPAPVHIPVAPPEPQTFSADYVRELRAENKGWRLKAQEQEAAAKAAQEAAAKAAQDAKDATEKAAKDAEERASAAEAAAKERVIRAELRTAAIRAGMIDLDGLKLLDISAIALQDDGTVSGADELMDAAKKAKPYLFGSATPSTSNPNPPPAPKPPSAKTALEMTDDEFAQAMRNRAWRR